MERLVVMAADFFLGKRKKVERFSWEEVVEVCMLIIAARKTGKGF